MWANLLTNAADPKNLIPISVSFVNILKELGPREVKFLNYLYDNTVGVAAEASLGAGGRDIRDVRYRYEELTTVFIRAGLSASGNFQLMSYKDHQDNKALVDADMRSFALTLDVVTRHDILRGSTEAEPLQLERDELYSINGSLHKVRVFEHYAFTYLGESFILACRPPAGAAKLL